MVKICIVGKMWYWLCMQLKSHFGVYFRLAHHTHQHRNFDLHKQPLPRFTNSTDFTVQQPNALYNFNILQL